MSRCEMCTRTFAVTSMTLLLLWSVDAYSFPAPRVMTPAERAAQVLRRGNSCNGTVVVASCWGFDPSDSTEFLQAALDSGARKVIIPPMCDDSYADCPVSQSTGDHKWVTKPLQIRSNTVIVLQTGVQLWAKRWEYTDKGDSVLNMEFVSNVDIIGYGAIVRMWKEDYAYRPGADINGDCQSGVGLPCNYSKAEWRHCINMVESENVTIWGLTVSSSGGDGIEIGGQEMTYPSPECTASHAYPGCHTPAILKHGGCCRVSVSRNVHIKDFVATNNYRCDMIAALLIGQIRDNCSTVATIMDQQGSGSGADVPVLAVDKECP